MSLDAEMESPLPICDHKLDPTIMLMAPPNTCKLTMSVIQVIKRCKFLNDEGRTLALIDSRASTHDMDAGKTFSRYYATKLKKNLTADGIGLQTS